MNLRSQAGMGILVTALASAAMAAPAAAVEAPVNVPFQGLEPVIPMDAPTISTAAPLPMPGAPTGYHPGRAGSLPDIGLPTVPLDTTMPESVVAAPLPEVIEGSELGQALLTTPRSKMAATTPGALVGNPFTQPHADRGGMPGLTSPKAGVIAPAVTGALDSQLGLAQPTA